MRPLLPALLLALASCGAGPAIEDRLPDPGAIGPAPPLVPLGPLLLSVGAPGRADPAPALEGRAARLADRAAALRGPVVKPAEASRIERGVDLAPLD